MTRFLLTTLLTGTLAVSPACHIRCGNARIAAAFAMSYARSEAFRYLVDTIESSNTYLYLEDGRCNRGAMRACLYFLSAPHGFRYLRIHVDSREPLMSVAGQIAHELHHATEIASRLDVVDAKTLLDLYREIGFESCTPRMNESCWETSGARATQHLVKAQMRRFRFVEAEKP